MNSLEIKERKAILVDKCKGIIAKCRSEVREMTEEETAEFEAAKAEIETLKQQLAELEAKLKSYEVEDDTIDEPMEMAGCTDKDKENKRNINFSTKMKTNKRFSLINAINDVVNNRSFSPENQAVIDAARKEMRGVAFSGQIQIPFNTNNRAAITVTSEGNDTVGIDLWDIEKPLRAKSVLAQAGAKIISNLQGDIQIPVMSGNQCYWEGETAPAKNGEATFSSVKLSPKRISAVIECSKTWLNQTSESVENILREDLINAINQKLEMTILGDGEAVGTTQPAGMFYGKSISTATDTFAKLCDLEASIEDANVTNPICYVASNKAKAAFRSMAKSSKNTELVYQGGEVDGTPLYSTSNCLQSGFIVGDFSQLAIGFWSNGVDIVIDGFSKADQNLVRIIANMYVDFAVLRPEAFAFGKTTV